MFKVREVIRQADEATKDDMTKRLIRTLGEIKETEEEKKNQTAWYSGQIKGLKTKVDKLTETIETGEMVVSIEVYGVENLDTEQMEYFDRDGVLVPDMTRPLNAQELIDLKKAKLDQFELFPEPVAEPEYDPELSERVWLVGDIGQDADRYIFILLAVNMAAKAGVGITRSGKILFLNMRALTSPIVPTTLTYKYTTQRQAETDLDQFLPHFEGANLSGFDLIEPDESTDDQSATTDSADEASTADGDSGTSPDDDDEADEPDSEDGVPTPPMPDTDPVGTFFDNEAKRQADAEVEESSVDSQDVEELHDNEPTTDKETPTSPDEIATTMGPDTDQPSFNANSERKYPAKKNGTRPANRRKNWTATVA